MWQRFEFAGVSVGWHGLHIVRIDYCHQYQLSFIACWALANVFSKLFQHPHCNRYLHFGRQRLQDHCAPNCILSAWDLLQGTPRFTNLECLSILLLSKIIASRTVRFAPANTKLTKPIPDLFSQSKTPYDKQTIKGSVRNTYDSQV